MTLPGLRWSEERVVQGHPPLGEVQTRCVGCRCRFRAGDVFVARMVGPLTVGAYAHPGCTERAEISA